MRHVTPAAMWSFDLGCLFSLDLRRILATESHGASHDFGGRSAKLNAMCADVARRGMERS